MLNFLFKRENATNRKNCIIASQLKMFCILSNHSRFFSNCTLLKARWKSDTETVNGCQKCTTDNSITLEYLNQYLKLWMGVKDNSWY